MSVVDLTSGTSYTTLSAAIAGSSANDVIQISAGSYVENFPDITHNLTIEAVGGFAYLSNLQPDPPNGRAVINVPGNLDVNLTLIGLDISGAVDDASNPPSSGGANGAGILFETGNGALVVENSHIHNNEDGILTGGANSFSLSGMTVTITNSEIDNNGLPPSNSRYGFDHNIYAGVLTQLTVTNSYIHDALGGHEIKSRADSTIITNDRIFDNNADTSYSIDLPNAGNAAITGNTIEQGPHSSNNNIMAYGEEGASNPGTNVNVANNTIVNDEPGTFLLNRTTTVVNFTNNQVWGLTAARLGGPMNASGTIFLTTRPTLDTSPVQYASLAGNHSQYDLANDSGSLYVQDLVPGRNGTQILPAGTQVHFTDGVGVFDPTGNAEEVARLYQAALNRGADVSGLDYWTAQIDTNALGIKDVALSFINSAEFSSKYGTLSNSGFVTQLYQNVLHRAPDAAGQADWVGQLNNGTSRAQVLIGFSDSLENKLNTQGAIGDPHMDEAYRLYQAALNRTPDTAGLGDWTAQLDSGVSLLQVAQGFVSSNEFSQLFAGLDTKGFVDKLYQNVLHRAPDSAGEQDWMNQLNSGVSKAQVLLGFSDSLENRVNTSQATHDSWVYIPST